MRDKRFTGRPDARVAQLATHDHGVLSTPELIACGLTRPGIQRRVESGRLHRLYQGVYVVGHAALGPEGRWLAAVKAGGPKAALSHQSAAQLWSLMPRYSGPMHITVPASRNPRPTRGLAIHRSRTLTGGEIVRRNRIPVTSPSRTLRDLKRILPREQWEAAVDRARGRGFDLRDVVVDEAPTRSALERKFLKICRRHRIPAPRVNVQVGGFLVDFSWPESRLIVEVDGYEFHRGRASFEADRARDAELAARGFRVVRFTYRHVTERPALVASRIRALLS
jgi:very-short-patch-repair endonuclease